MTNHTTTPDITWIKSSDYANARQLKYDLDHAVTQAGEALARADSVLGTGKTDEALYWYVKALELDARNITALNHIGSLYRERKRFDLATHAFQIALQIDPANADALEGNGLVLLDKHDYRQAETLLKKALQINDSRWRSHNALGLIADLNQQFDQAEQQYQTALKTATRDTDIVLNNLGYSRYLRGDWKSALDFFNSALNVNPKSETAWLNMALVQARQGHEDAAIQSFRQVLSESDTYNNMGYIKWMEGRQENAESYLQRAISSSPHYHVMAHENLQLVRNHAGEGYTH